MSYDLFCLQEDKEFAAKIIAKLEENEVDEDELIEQRRRKRQELMAKLQQEKEAAGAAFPIWLNCRIRVHSSSYNDALGFPTGLSQQKELIPGASSQQCFSCSFFLHFEHKY